MPKGTKTIGEVILVEQLLLLSAHLHLIAVFFSLKSLNKISTPPVSFIQGSDWWVFIQVFYFHFLGMGLYLLIAMTSWADKLLMHYIQIQTFSRHPYNLYYAERNYIPDTSLY